ncbi:DNA primase [bacterium]|nr:DNA primase [bacterium]|tara:strand:- start:2127 stop:3830 length:1704 start_codon:yes stop_codon:yes gene_type:complete
MSGTVEKIKSRLGIVDVVSSYLKLEKAGGNFKAPCPFHNEKTPSFFVSPGRDSYHCFGCNRGGDIFSFIEEIEGVEFREALKILADRAGVEIEKVDPKTQGEKERLFKLLEEATEFYKENLELNKEVVSYLKKRGLTEQTIKDFKIGYVPDEWRSLLTHLEKKGYGRDLIEKAGMIIPGDKHNSHYDRFRNRVMFPLSDHMGRVVGFSGRIYGNDEKGGKYINTPQTLLYDKSRILYPYHLAKEAIRKKNECIFVEGQMDVIMSHQAGITNTVAVSGTALTADHLNIIKRLAGTIVFAFDSDGAGKRALLRGGEMALATGLNVKVVLIDKKDPADLILEDKTKWLYGVKGAKHIVEYIMERLIETQKESRALKQAVNTVLVPLLSRIENKIDQAHFVTLVSQKADIPEKALREELEKVDKETPKESVHQKQKEEQTIVKERKERIIEEIIGLYLWSMKEKISVDEVAREVRETVGEDELKKRIQKLDKNKQTELEFKAELWYKDSDRIIDQIHELFDSYKAEVLRDKSTELFKKLKEAEHTQDLKKAEEYQKEHFKIQQELDKLKNQ